jgi:hypothetical protein
MLYCSALWQFFRAVAHNTAFFRVTAQYEEKCSTLLPTTPITAQFSVPVCYSALLPTKQIVVPCCEPQRGKMIDVVSYTAEKWSAFMSTTLKMIEYLHGFETF